MKGGAGLSLPFLKVFHNYYSIPHPHPKKNNNTKINKITCRCLTNILFFIFILFFFCFAFVFLTVGNYKIISWLNIFERDECANTKS